MTMTASYAPPPPEPNCHSRLSRVSGSAASPAPPLPEDDFDGSLLSREEYQALMVAEFGALEPLFTPNEFPALMLADDEIMAPLFPQDEFPATMAAMNDIQAPILPVAPRLGKEKRGEKRKRPPATKEKAQPPALPPLPRPPKEAKMKFPTPRDRNEMVANSILRRRHRAPELSGRRRRTLLWCQCRELPLDSPGCPLHQDTPHQDTPHRSWMLLTHDSIPDVGGAGAVQVPKVRSGHNNREVTRYVRWRSKAWMPSRFYLEHVKEEVALQEEEEVALQEEDFWACRLDF